jgi:hypothetical protein
MRIGNLSRCEAEDLIASVWLILEKYHITSPRLSVHASPEGLEEVRLIFANAADSHFVEREYFKGIPARSGLARVGAAMRETDPVVAPRADFAVRETEGFPAVASSGSS